MFHKTRNSIRFRFRIKPLIFLSLFNLSILSALYVFSEENRLFTNKNALNFNEIPELLSEEPQPVISPKNPSFSLQPFQTPNILFIVADETLPDPLLDQPFFDFLTTNLSYLVTYHDADNSYDYSNYDAIIISDSISGSVDVTSLENASIPILTMGKDTWSVFNLGTGRATSSQQELWIDNTSHYITNQSILGLTSVYNMTAKLNYIKGYNALPLNSDILPLGLVGSTTPDKFYGTLVALDKGGRDFTGINTTTDRIAFLGTSQGEYLNLDGWKLWNNTLKWILYDDDSGNATINVNTLDINGNPVTNANVTLVNSFNPTNFTTQYTDENADSTFSNISFGKYDILAKNNLFPNSLNSTYISQEIIGTRTFHREALFNYVITLNFSLDTVPPLVENISFQKIGYIFFIDVFDVDQLDAVLLNMTVYNTSNYITPYLSPKNYTMRSQSGPHGDSGTYYNDTALNSLNHTEVEVLFNFIVNDTFGYTTITTVQSLFLEDLDAPIIRGYNVTDYGNGTLEFYANITDNSGIEDHVSLAINGTLAQMHLNGSNLWTYRTQYFYGDFLTYTVFSVNDTVGNENGSKLYPIVIGIGEISVSDYTPPQIFWITPYTAHDKGFVEWNVRINETSSFQSGIDFNSVNITFSVNGGSNITQLMFDLGANYFYYSDTFNFNDTVEFWINASDWVGNFRIEHAIFEITDIALPQVTFSAIEFGNGTVKFSATVVDWPNNITTVFAYENSTGIWKKYILENITNTLYVGTFNNFSFINRDLFYFVEAKDESGNNNTLTRIKYLLLTDIISPTINLNIENSPSIDGQITIRALAIDSWGTLQYVTNAFYVNITHQGITTKYEMEQEIIYFVSTHSFTFGDQLVITVWTYDDAENQGIKSTSITVSDQSPPKILDWGVYEYQNGNISIWANVAESSLGSGLFINNTSVKLEYIFKQAIEEIMVIKEEDIYWYTISGFEPGNAFTYRISVIDNIGNINSTGWNAVSILDKTPPTCLGFGYQEEKLNYT
ncbi:MAG: carboxypeptidase-like regulatory domain-containing protein, partial [Candidatus Hodarchaeota archaeon]